MEITEEIVSEKILEELDLIMEDTSSNHSIIGTEFVDLENQEITIKFRYIVVPEDNYIGLISY